MYLRSLEIQGFKSFPDKTRITFDKPITGIVGPNGSGKSNISDAIMWVMGEQSTRALRGGKMEDVIFGGTQKRAQVGFAEVSLFLDNSDGSLDFDGAEIMLTRRYYRSGESEYYINKAAVRLKDMHELLMDTGLGREGYCIIGQGRIDEILSAKSTDRRDIFEEAAGISRYRHRKEEAQRKLQHTDDNLVRIDDKISELEYQVEPLRAQAETAKKYLLLRDELRGLEISVWMENLDALGAQREKLELDRVTAKQQLEAVTAELEESYAAAETFAERMRAKDVQAEAVREQMSQTEARHAENESMAAVLRANLENNTRQIERIRQELAEQEGRVGGIAEQIKGREERLEEISSEKERLSRDTSGLWDESEKLSELSGTAARELDALLREEAQAAQDLSDRRAQLSAFASAAQEMYDRENALAQEAVAAAEKLSQIRGEAGAADERRREAQTQRTSLQNVIRGYVMRAESRRGKTDQALEKKNRLTMELGAMRSRIALLTEMEKEYGGYSKAVRLVMQEHARGVLKNIRGTVAGLVETDDRYAVAIETALGAAMQNIIVDTEEDGKAAIAMLKRRDGGRATFLPVSAIRSNTLNVAGLEGEAGFEGVAVELVRFDKRYAGIYASLLGRAVIVGSMDDAIRMARGHHNSFRIVTLDGQVINAGGSMTGGSSAQNAGILSRANELKQLSARQELLSQELAAAEREYAEAQRELTAAEYELETASNEMRALEDSLLKLQTEREHFEALIGAHEESAEALREESRQLAARIGKNSDDTERLKSEIGRGEEDAAQQRGRIEEKNRERQALQDRRERLNASLSGLGANIASLDAERDALKKAVTELAALSADLSGGRMQQQAAYEALQKSCVEITQEIRDRASQSAVILDQIARHKAHISGLTEEKLALEAQRTQRERLTQEKNKELLELERECARFDQRLQAVDMEEKQSVEKLWDSYELSRSVAMQLRKPLDSLNAARRRVAELRREIAQLGNPNIGAIDEYERVNGRYLYLTEQRDDVLKAKEELDGIIRDITAEMKAIFSREFELLNASFKETFAELFGGGQAQLELDDPDDVLSSGIEIRVQPPGKSLKTLTLLSGGEKAFVAIALYFSILKVRPTPFVVVDEIEAALDEVNVLRFADYMRKMSARTQIIVISHRRGTMEEADVLYGVTMQEQGVSRILTVDLAEAERNLK